MRHGVSLERLRLERSKTNHGLEGLLERLSVVVCRTGTKTGKKETRDAGEVHLRDLGRTQLVAVWIRCNFSRRKIAR